ncbi:MAG: hypothetical protein KKB95_22980 [Gammaproteobacteria bacterium]|nr:hypothetical protein [Gammaproteobacteria bacterium]MBU1506603.1 hypothetical protein [Gammaproteobacteria bacterium]MBU2121569.1 hypothetical protein [Gammaproteobacteria bacterium]MBU2173201.1 hypothetical protein [Gammaproteobacteria bacterium]MBU2199528.1 hypothetical protein [Gammaproteobacteria bacterium]
MTVSPAAVLALALASVVSVFATTRADSRITGPLGWTLTLLLTIAGGLLLGNSLGGPEAVAVATIIPMGAIPAFATLLGWHRRRGGADGRR